MSGKIVPAIAAAMLLAGIAAASAQAPSAEGAGNTVGAFSGYSGDYGYQGYYNFAPGTRNNGSAPGRTRDSYEPGSSSTR